MKEFSRVVTLHLLLGNTRCGFFTSRRHDITGRCHTFIPVNFPPAHVRNGICVCAAFALVIHPKRETPTISDEGSLTNHTIKQNYCLYISYANVGIKNQNIK